MIKLKLTISCFVFFLTHTAFAQFASESPSLNRRVRNLGMGNVGVALKGTHGSSPFYNPAGLNDIEKGRFEFFAITGEVSKNSFDLIGDVKDLVSDLGDENSNAGKTNVFNDFVQENAGDFRRLRFTLDIFNYVRKNFAIGLLIDEKMDLSVRDPNLPEFHIRNLGDAAMFISGATGFWDGLLQAGVTLKPTLRFALDQNDQVVEIQDALGEDANGNPLVEGQFKNIYEEQRFGIGADIGLKSNLGFSFLKDLKVYKLLQPQVGFTWQDIGNPEFGRAERNEQSMSLGFAIHPEIWKLKNAIAIDIRDLNQEKPFLSKFHFGLESKLPWVVSARAGVNQGYFTAGASFDLWVVELEGAIYFEEVGINSRREGNQRYAVRLSFNI